MHHYQKGLTLIEMALTLVIVGILLGLSFTLLTNLSKINNVKKTKNNMEIVKEALVGYLLSHGRLPYAGDATGNEINGQYVGKVPYVTLGLPKADASDAYGRVFDYDVTGNTTNNARLTDTSSLNICHQLAAFISGTSTPTTEVTLDGGNTFTPVAFVLLAPGNNKQYEGENSDGDRQYEAQNPSSDDIVMWEGFNNLYAQLDCGGEYYKVFNENTSGGGGSSSGSIYVKGGNYLTCTEIKVGNYFTVDQKGEVQTYTDKNCQTIFDPDLTTYLRCQQVDFGSTGNRNTEVAYDATATLVDR